MFESSTVTEPPTTNVLIGLEKLAGTTTIEEKATTTFPLTTTLSNNDDDNVQIVGVTHRLDSPPVMMPSSAP